MSSAMSTRKARKETCLTPLPCCATALDAQLTEKHTNKRETQGKENARENEQPLRPDGGVCHVLLHAQRAQHVGRLQAGAGARAAARHSHVLQVGGQGGVGLVWRTPT